MKDSSFARLKGLASEIGQTLQVKNMQYGDSFSKAPEILKILFPNGVQPEMYDDLLTIVRMLDKLNRISAGKGETEDPYKDLAGYAILAQVLHEERKEENKMAMPTPAPSIAQKCIEAEKRIYDECKAEILVKDDQIAITPNHVFKRWG